MPVFRENAASTKTRLVLDPSKELNYLCHTGPAFDNYIGGTLLTNLHLSRVSKFIVTGDISKVFHQIILFDLDQDYFGMVVGYGRDLIKAKWHVNFTCHLALIHIVKIFGANCTPLAPNQALTSSVVLADYDSGVLTRQQASELDPDVKVVLEAFDTDRSTCSSSSSSDPPPRFILMNVDSDSESASTSMTLGAVATTSTRLLSALIVGLRIGQA
ncbi:hypothetical protein FOL47_008391 [Perkinsus chesapeaki]|uniref:Uncharacterized protein n=1 Tax=Perkinsus chesapeaki TaxID=330153 RepID=A0A7J6LEB1_PERCH|nr:hypothetical protein FOL47_008391 [Perkinsus chesapeaki]